MKTPQTQNLIFGFYGTMHLAGFNAASLWDTAVSAIKRATLHEDIADIAAWLDSKDGRHFADYVVDGLRQDKPVNAAVNAAVRCWMAMRPDAETVGRHGVPACSKPRSKPPMPANRLPTVGFEVLGASIFSSRKGRRAALCEKIRCSRHSVKNL